MNEQQRVEELLREATPEDEPTRLRAFLPLILLLVLINIPWYLSAEFAGQRFLGLPLFAWIALATSLCISVVTAYVGLRRWKDTQ